MSRQKGKNGKKKRKKDTHRGKKGKGKKEERKKDTHKCLD